MALLLLAGLLTLASGQSLGPCPLQGLPPGPCPLARILVGSPRGSWAGQGVFAGGHPLPARGRLLHLDQHCTVPSAQEPFIFISTSIASAVCSVYLRIADSANNNASAILILVDEHIESFRQVSARSYHSEGSVVFILKSQGLDILELISNSSSAYISIEELNQPHNLNKPKKYFLLSAVFVTIFVFIVGCYGSWYYRDGTETMEHRNHRKAGEDFSIDATIDKIPTRKLLDNNEKVIEEYHICAVCFEYYKLAEIISSLPCSHIFHKHCVHPWLVERRSCPLCKMDILKHYGLPAASSEESIINIPLDDVVSYLEGVSV